MPYPYIRSSSSGCATKGTVGWDITAPPTIEDGDTVIVFYMANSTAEWSAVGGWTLVGAAYKTGTPRAASMAVIYKKAADGLPVGGSTIEPGKGSHNDVAYVAYAVAGGDPDDDPPQAAFTTGAANPCEPNPPSLAPTGGSKMYLWFAAYGADTSSTTGSLTGWPDSFVLGQHDPACEDPVGRPLLDSAAAGRQATAVSLNPDPFSTSFYYAPPWVAATVAVHPTLTLDDDVSPACLPTLSSFPAADARAVTRTQPASLSTSSTFPAPTLQNGQTVSPACLDTSSTFPPLNSVRVEPACLTTMILFPTPTIYAGGWRPGFWVTHIDRAVTVRAER